MTDFGTTITSGRPIVAERSYLRPGDGLYGTSATPQRPREDTRSWFFAEATLAGPPRHTSSLRTSPTSRPTWSRFYPDDGSPIEHVVRFGPDPADLAGQRPRERACVRRQLSSRPRCPGRADDPSQGPERVRHARRRLESPIASRSPAPGIPSSRPCFDSWLDDAGQKPVSRRPATEVVAWMRLARVFQRMNQATAEELRRFGLSVGQFDVLVNVGRSPEDTSRSCELATGHQE